MALNCEKCRETHTFFGNSIRDFLEMNLEGTGKGWYCHACEHFNMTVKIYSNADIYEKLCEIEKLILKENIE